MFEKKNDYLLLDFNDIKIIAKKFDKLNRYVGVWDDLFVRQFIERLLKELYSFRRKCEFFGNYSNDNSKFTMKVLKSDVARLEESMNISLSSKSSSKVLKKNF